ncbi:MAG: hypothetical protein ACK5O2_16990, partial [Microthrixaceae bacterium]
MFDKGSRTDGSGERDGSDGPSGSGVAGCVVGVVAALDGVVGVDLAGVDGRELMGVVETLEGVRRRVDAVTALAINRLDITGVTETVRGL